MAIGDLLDTRDYYQKIGVWPAIPALAKPEQWLKNFLPDEQKYAHALLDSFIYVNGEMTEKMFTSAFHNLSLDVCSAEESYRDKKAAWIEFRRSIIVTHPTGETPNTSDSGYLFERKARQLLGVGQNNLMEPASALKVLTGDATRPVVFVDDFAGSGDQFIKTWTRRYMVDGQITSFLQLASQTTLQVYYAPAICTERAASAIEGVAPSVRIRPAHRLPELYSVFHPSSIMLDPSELPNIEDVVKRAGLRGGISEARATGWNSLGLTLAFEHSIPDATLPIFWHESETWTPLMRRT